MRTCMELRLSTIFLLTIYFTHALAQTKSRLHDSVVGKWTLTRYTETFDGETYNRPIAGLKNYEPKTDSIYKEMNQGDTVSVYEFMFDQTYSLFGNKEKRVGKWRTSDKDSLVTLYDIQAFTSKGPLPKSNGSYDLKMFSSGGLFLLLSSYDSGLNSTHKLYYKKTTRSD
jgi:hypothetical protein